VASVFLSYSSEDRQTARRIGDALTSFGLDVWLDESELGGGDAWDQKIRRQIRECDYFMPIISARTEARHEGYFRREWRIAVERTLDIADDHLFLLPVVIDGTDETRARVPEKFLSVQWLRLPDGEPTPQLEALCRRILAGGVLEPTTEKKKPTTRLVIERAAGPPAVPPFPHEEPGQRIRFFFQVLGWMVRTAWAYFLKLPRWLRWVIYVWGAVYLMSHDFSSSSRHQREPSEADLRKLKAITEQYRNTTDPAELAKLGQRIAKEFPETSTKRAAHNPILAIPFSAAPGDAAGAKLADSAFTQTYGRLAVSRHGGVDVGSNALAPPDLTTALDEAHKTSARYVLFGYAAPQGKTADVLTVTIAEVEDGTILWTSSYPITTADPAKIAADVDGKMPPPDED
jgi:hypothetical protein